MTHHWDEFSKSLAEELVPRRESLRRIGLVLAGAVLSPIGLGTAFAARKARQQDPCKAFCQCRVKKQQNACLAACKACGNDPRYLCGSCAGGYACTDLASDPYNCGACGYVCDEPGPSEYGACINGRCEYVCAEGAVRCEGTCTFLGWDSDNCGACGLVCGDDENCAGGVCQPELIPVCPSGGYCGDGKCICGEGQYCEPFSQRCAISEQTPF
jgi:hypothetical protein